MDDATAFQQLRRGLVSRLNMLLAARQRLIEAEATATSQGHVVRVDQQPSGASGDDHRLAGGGVSEPPSCNDGNYSLPPGSCLRRRDQNCAQLTAEPTSSNIDSLRQTGGADDPIMPMVTDRETEDSNLQCFGQAYHDYVSGCSPSAATIAGNYNQLGSGGGDEEAGGASRPEAPADNNGSHDGAVVWRCSVCYNNVDSLHRDDDTTDDPAVFGDDFYPLDDEPSYDDDGRRENHWYDPVYYDSLGDTLLHLDNLYDGGDDEASEEHIRQAVIAGRLHVPHIIDASNPAAFTTDEDDGFGGVPASAAAIAGLEKRKYDGSSSSGGADDGGSSCSRCVICMREYKKGARLAVMPCESRHRFHGKCLRKWLSRSRLCPLCRHALPTEGVVVV